MSLTGRQHGLYKHLWDAVVAIKPGTGRVAMHAELGLPESRRDWNNGHFDRWKAACLAITEPAWLGAQIDGLDGECKRRRHVIRGLLARLDAPDAYAEKIAQNMGLAGTMETLAPPDLERVIVALRLQCRRSRAAGKSRSQRPSSKTSAPAAGVDKEEEEEEEEVGADNIPF